jgi:beta-glucosidase
MKTAFFFTAIAACFVSLTVFAQDEPSAARIEKILKKMTLEEKVALCHADSKFSVAGIPRLGIPALHLSDGPHGVREEISHDSWQPAGRDDDYSTYLPTGTALAATWNVEMARRFGDVLGAEARERGKDVILGPGINIQRTPLCGRNFEYLGEDPCLTARMIVPEIRAIQSHDVAACVKHFALNNQELDRDWVNVDVDEQTLREIYLPGFEAAVREARVRCVMGAYNQFRGGPCCQSAHLIRDILKGEWGFRGVLMTDWNVRGIDTWTAATNGLDLEMGTALPYDEFYFARPLREAVANGSVPVAVLDEKVRRMLRLMFEIRAMGGKRETGSRNTPEHQKTARAIAAEAMVLLKNESVLPFDKRKIKRLAVIGENATVKHAHGGWSSEIKTPYEITPLEGIAKKAGDSVEIIRAQGYKTAPQISDEADVALIGEAVAAAKKADAVILVVGQNHRLDTEGSDRPDMKLHFGQNELIEAVLAANPNTAIVLVGGSAVEMPWIAKAPAVLQAWYAGMEGGSALADILFGDTNPSGKLPFTFPAKLADSPAHALGEYQAGHVEYKEGLLVGYRWFDTKKIEPLFPFGHGLSYTAFEYGDLKIENAQAKDGAVARVTLDLKNSGKREGAEVVQIYVQGPADSKIARPAKELRAFQKVFLRPGEHRTVRLALRARDFSYYDVAGKTWRIEPGTYNVLAGSSSRDMRLNSTFAPHVALVK